VPDSENPPLSSTDVAKYLGISPRKLYDLRAIGDGPPWQSIGRRIVYRQPDVDKWIRDQTHRVVNPPPATWRDIDARLTWNDLGDATPLEPDDPAYGGPHEPDPDEHDPNLDR
jgi:predicted DNA-binding transcriptional regulator AlpA